MYIFFRLFFFFNFPEHYLRTAIIYLKSLSVWYNLRALYFEALSITGVLLLYHALQYYYYYDRLISMRIMDIVMTIGIWEFHCFLYENQFLMIS